MSIRSRLGAAYGFVGDTVDGFSDDRAEILAAALAFYTLLSLAPLVIIAVAIAGTLLGRAEAREEVTRALSQATSATVAQTVNGWVDQAVRAKGVASVIGGGLLLVTASRLFEQLKSALDQIFHIEKVGGVAPMGFGATARSYVLRKLFGFAMVLGAGVVLLAVTISRAALDAISSRVFAGAHAATLAALTQLTASLVLVAGVMTLMFELVPSRRIGWRPASIGALVTSVLFTFGNTLLGLYLGRAAVVAAYGAAGSAVVVLLWFFYSAQIMLVGAEVTQVAQRRRASVSSAVQTRG